MKLPTLYSRTATGAIQQWQIIVQDNAYMTVAGQIDGKKVESEWTYCGGKNIGRANETTPAEQAQAEAKAKWQKKIDKGYRQNISDIDTQSFVKPMLAKVWDDYTDKIEYPVYSQPKLDGIRCIASKDGLFSRNGKEFVSVPHIYQTLKEKFFNIRLPVVFDGELYADKYANDFNKICSIAKKTKPTKEDLLFAANNIEYHIYDIIPSKNTKFSDRISFLWTLDHMFVGPLKLVKTCKLYSKGEVDRWYENYIEDGYEGQMIRLDLPYENKRSKSLLKRKEFQDAEFEIISVNEGIGNRSGVAGNMTLRDSTGKIFNSNIKGDFGLLAQYLVDKNKLAGKMATVKYFNLTPDGVPRFPFVIAVRDYE